MEYYWRESVSTYLYTNTLWITSAADVQRLFINFVFESKAAYMLQTIARAHIRGYMNEKTDTRARVYQFVCEAVFSR